MEKILDMLNINKKSAIPLYCQIRDELEELINNDYLTEGDDLPSENQISGKLDVSRMTVRKSIEELEKKGVVKKEKGKRTKVIDPKINQSLVAIKSFTESIEEKGFTTHSELLEFNVTGASSNIINRLRLPAGRTKIILIKRLRWIEDHPVGIHKSYLPYYLCKELRKYKNKLNESSLYYLLDKFCSLKPIKCEETLEIIKANANESKLLQTEVNEPLFRVEALAESRENKIMEFAEAKYRSDVFKFNVVNTIDRR